MVVVGVLLIECAVLASPLRGAAAAEGGCGGTRIIVTMGEDYTTNDVPGCPKGGEITGTDRTDYLYGGDGEDEMRGLGEPDDLYGGLGGDVIYGGSGDDSLDSGEIGGVMRLDGSDDVLYGGDGSDLLFGYEGEDVLYGGDGNDFLDGSDGGPKDNQRDELHCGAGKDKYLAGRLDHVSNSCEEGKLVDTGGPPLLLLVGATLLGGLVLIRHVIRYT
jgi:Ca2+-binding RTX toxin-like protein